MQHGTYNGLVTKYTRQLQTTVFSNVTTLIFQCRCSIANLCCVFIWRIFVKQWGQWIKHRKLNTRGLTFGNQFWSAVPPLSLLCYTVRTQPHTHCPAQWVLLARSLLWRWQPQSIILIIVLFWFCKEPHIPPGNLSCTPRGTCNQVWEPLS